MPNRVHVLIVEDNAAQAQRLESACTKALSPTDLLIELAEDSSTAHDLLASQHFDIAICDLAIPATGVSLIPDRMHGLRVVRTIRDEHGGLPLIIVSEHSDDPALMRNLMRDAGSADPYGAGAEVPMLVCFGNEELPECERELAAALNRSIGVAQVSITGAGAAALTISQTRAIQVFARSCEGSAAQVAAAKRGRSEAKTLRLTVHGIAGQETAHVAAKLGSREWVAGEMIAHRQASSMLPVGLGVPLTSTVAAGASGEGGAFYGLAVYYTRNLVECLDDAPDDAAKVVQSLSNKLAPVYALAPQRQLSVLDIRRDIVGRADARLAGSLESAIVELNDHKVLVTECIQHGDMHGENVLVNDACEPMLIDYGDVRRTSGCLDPLTLELSTVFHPAARTVRGAWPTETQASSWEDLDTYVESCPFEGYIRECRKWTMDVAASREEIAAVLLSYCLRQLRYPECPKPLARTLIDLACRSFS